MVKRWLWATATVSAALAVHGALRGHLRRAAAAALTAVLLATATRQHSRGTTVTSGGRPARYPKQYVARKATVQPIDGDLEKAVWSLVPWSEDFVEIRGGDAPTSAKPTKWEATRVKMLWDDEYLYIGAMMDVDAGNELIAKFKERNSPIFHTDSDFEVFLDPAGCCHGYKELEINALNTVWNLLLDRPYSDGGGEFSGRVAKQGERSHWDVRGQKTAVKVTKGRIGNPSAAAQWCVEIALAHSDSLPNAPVQAAEPFVGGCWRINFSRVEKQGKVNWVWAPQVVWSPTDGRHVGQVNMHLPDAWGYVVFADEVGKLSDGSDAKDFVDTTFPARHACACVYYACRAFHEVEGRFLGSWEELYSRVLLPELLDAQVSLRPRNDGYVAQVAVAGRKVQVNNLRLITVVA